MKVCDGMMRMNSLQHMRPLAWCDFLPDHPRLFTEHQEPITLSLLTTEPAVDLVDHGELWVLQRPFNPDREGQLALL